MRAATILSTLLAVAVSAAALPVDAEVAIVEKRGNCDHGYFDCVTSQQQFCNFLGLCGAGMSALACTQQCVQRVNEDCRSWCK